MNGAWWTWLTSSLISQWSVWNAALLVAAAVFLIVSLVAYALTDDETWWERVIHHALTEMTETEDAVRALQAERMRLWRQSQTLLNNQQPSPSQQPQPPDPDRDASA